MYIIITSLCLTSKVNNNLNYKLLNITDVKMKVSTGHSGSKMKWSRTVHGRMALADAFSVEVRQPREVKTWFLVGAYEIEQLATAVVRLLLHILTSVTPPEKPLLCALWRHQQLENKAVSLAAVSRMSVVPTFPWIFFQTLPICFLAYCLAYLGLVNLAEGSRKFLDVMACVTSHPR